jgi:inositol-phosphate transport system permease protein
MSSAQTASQTTTLGQTGFRALPLRQFLLTLRNGGIVVAGMAALAYVFGSLLRPLTAAAHVEEDVTVALAQMLAVALPYAGYLVVGHSARRVRQIGLIHALVTAWLAAALIFLAITAVHSLVTVQAGVAQKPSLQLTLAQTDQGILVESVESGGAAEAAGLRPGDVILALRRDTLSRDELVKRIEQAAADEPFRFRILRDGQEIQLTARTVMVAAAAHTDLWGGLLIALAVSAVGLFWPGPFTPYVLLIMSLLPLLAGYAWLVIATFSYRTQGLLPVDSNGRFGGLTLDNWRFLGENMIANQAVNIWSITFNSFMIAVLMTAASLTICSMTGYALSRMEFAGRRGFLALSLLLHSFPAVTLIIPIYLVLISLGSLPLIGRWIGFNTLGGIALVMVAFELPLGVWLMKGFFDGISWDMERSALIDGANRWRAFWQIILPQIRPGLLALGIFSFINGWNAYLIPATYSIGMVTSTLPVYIKQLTGDVVQVNWNQVAAVGLFQMIPILLLFVIAQEYLLNIYAGGTKGST